MRTKKSAIKKLILILQDVAILFSVKIYMDRNAMQIIFSDWLILMACQLI